MSKFESRLRAAFSSILHHPAEGRMAPVLDLDQFSARPRRYGGSAEFRTPAPPVPSGRHAGIDSARSRPPRTALAGACEDRRRAPTRLNADGSGSSRLPLETVTCFEIGSSYFSGADFLLFCSRVGAYARANNSACATFSRSEIISDICRTRCASEIELSDVTFFGGSEDPMH
jgi:hypothetical protein